MLISLAMRTRDDIEAYLGRTGLSFKEVAEGTWVISDPERYEQLALRLEGPLAVFRLKAMDLGKVKSREALFKRLLELNASELVHAAFGLDGDSVVLSCTLPLENMDYNEFAGTLEDFSLAVVNHHGELSGL